MGVTVPWYSASVLLAARAEVDHGSFPWVAKVRAALPAGTGPRPTIDRTPAKAFTGGGEVANRGTTSCRHRRKRCARHAEEAANFMHALWEWRSLPESDTRGRLKTHQARDGSVPDETVQAINTNEATQLIRVTLTAHGAAPQRRAAPTARRP
jgi:hypothetical protein